MKFNLSKMSGIAMIRKLCPDVKADDLEGISAEELVSLAKRIEKKAVGQGGSLGPSWTQVDNHNPYRADPMVTAVPQFGGGTFDKQRQTLPGGTSNETNKSQNSDEQTRGPNGSLSPKGNERSSLPDPDAEYVVSFVLRPWDNHDQIRKMFGKGSETDGREVRIVEDSYERAVSKQRGLPPGTIVTRRMRRVK